MRIGAAAHENGHARMRLLIDRTNDRVIDTRLALFCSRQPAPTLGADAESRIRSGLCDPSLRTPPYFSRRRDARTVLAQGRRDADNQAISTWIESLRLSDSEREFNSLRSL